MDRCVRVVADEVLIDRSMVGPVGRALIGPSGTNDVTCNRPLNKLDLTSVPFGVNAVL